MAFTTVSSGPSSEINVTPLIDVLLVLLIIFMIIVPVTPRGLESQVPQTRPSADDSQQSVSVHVLAGATAGEVRYELEGRPIAPEELGAGLRQLLAERSQRSVWVTASPQVGYSVVAEIVSEARSAGAEAVGLGRL
jgi:biopolymer transport protein ExbD